MIGLNAALAFIMFGIALDIRMSDFKEVYKAPRGVAVGVLSQFVLLPLITVFLVWMFKPSPGIALGMILVAACPGGNVSNFISALSGANIALSVSLTAFATLLCPLLTPLNFHLWASILPNTSGMLQSFQLSFFDMLSTVFVVLLLPSLLGMWLRAKKSRLADVIGKPVRILSFLILMAFIGLAISGNFEAFKNHLLIVFFIVLVHNAMAFLTGYFTARIALLGVTECRSVCVETGIQNSGLGLIIIFTFFGGNGEMALVAAWWGVWHIVAGLALALFFRKGSFTLKRVAN